MADSITDIVKQVMADIFNIDAAAIDDDTEMDNVEKRDSANHVSLVLALEEEFSISFEISEIESMLTFYDIVTTVESKI